MRTFAMLTIPLRFDVQLSIELSKLKLVQTSVDEETITQNYTTINEFVHNMMNHC
jgi:hypothetical protein